VKIVLGVILIYFGLFANTNFDKGFKAYSTQKYEKAIQDLKPMAINEDMKSKSILGVTYASGRRSQQGYYKKVANHAKDDKKSVEWYIKAAEQGNRDAQYHLGIMYVNGEGVPKDYKKAVKWYTKAGKQGEPNAQYNLGYMYKHGLGVLPDYKKAVEWYTKAANQDYIKAQSNLGFMYDSGQGVPRDYKKAIEWYKKAISLGDTASKCKIAYPFFHLKKYEEAKKYAQEGYNEGETKACQNAWNILDLANH